MKLCCTQISLFSYKKYPFLHFRHWLWSWNSSYSAYNSQFGIYLLRHLLELGSMVLHIKCRTSSHAFAVSLRKNEITPKSASFSSHLMQLFVLGRYSLQFFTLCFSLIFKQTISCKSLPIPSLSSFLPFYSILLGRYPLLHTSHASFEGCYSKHLLIRILLRQTPN